jgi:signal peptidase I
MQKTPQAPETTTSANAEPKRSEKEGLFHFGREMISALLMALIFIVYVVQAFKIPTGSMEDSLLVGDFLLGLKFMYGSPVAPFSYAKFPGVTNPKPGDVVIFKYPGTDRKDYIKRCVAGPGQTVEIRNKQLFVNGKELVLPPRGKYERDGQTPLNVFAPLRIPAAGDELNLDALPVRELLFAKHLIRQEHPREDVRLELQLYINDEFANNTALPLGNGAVLNFADLMNKPVFFSSQGQVTINHIDNWLELEHNLNELTAQLKMALGDSSKVVIRPIVTLQDKAVSRYKVKKDNYFMMGDNRDNSLDSRYWGYLNDTFVKAQAFILYFSLDKEVPLYLLPLKIRWDRIGKLIRSWDGLGVGEPVQAAAAL